jgi:hypothetical protein
MLLAYREDPSFFAVGRALKVHQQTAQRCVECAVSQGPLAALDDRARPGKEPTITAEAKAWLVDLACRKAKELGYHMSCGRRGCWPAMRASRAFGRAPVFGQPRPGYRVQDPQRPCG